MKEYLPRVFDKLLERRLAAKGAILIEGRKMVWQNNHGLTAVKKHTLHARSQTKAANLLLADMAPLELLAGLVPRLIDEWQLAPKLWDAIRFEVDQRDEFGQFILTGSSVPANTDEISHSGTGRIARARMRPMTLLESKDSSGEVSLEALFAGREMPVSKTEAQLEDIAFLVCRGGWPRAVGQSREIALQQAYDYVDAVVEEDLSQVDGVIATLIWEKY